MPQKDVWGLALQFLPAYLTRPLTKYEYVSSCSYWDGRDWKPDQYRQEGRDLLALILANKPITPEAYHAHSEAKLLLLRRALSFSQQVGRKMLNLARASAAHDHVNLSDATFDLAMQRPRRHTSPERRGSYPEIFWAVPALGETDEDAQFETDCARASAEYERERARDGPDYWY